MSQTTPTRIVGFDLGHGETAVSVCKVTDNNVPEELDVWNVGSKSVITAIGWHPTNGPMIGEDALTNVKVERTRICFKGDPAGRPGEAPAQTAERNQVVQSYFKAWIDKLIANNQVSVQDRTKYYVGCPSGWSHESIATYRKLLSGIGLTELVVMKESRAGFVNTVENKMATISLNDLRKNVLIVDIGSSTTDLTLVQGLIDEDFGNPQLGAALIEQTIFERTLDEQKEAATWREIFERNPKVKSRCEIACRKTKERYFKSEQNFVDDPTATAQFPETVAGLGDFRPLVSHSVMESVLDTPQRALNGRSWRETFRQTLVDVRQRLDQRGVKLAALVLTGGPSRMSFTRALCREVFPDVHFEFDSSPEFCISRGLAFAGRLDTRTEEFTREVESLCDSGKFEEIMRSRLPALIARLVDSLADGLTASAIKPSIEGWKNGQIATLQDLEGVCDERGNVVKEGQLSRAAKAWLESEPAHEKVQEAIVGWFGELQGEIYAAGIDALCAKYQIPSSKLRPDVRGDLKRLLSGQKVDGLDVIDLEFINNMLGAIVVVITTAIVHALIVAIHFAAGPFAWIVGIGVGVAAAVYGMDEARRLVKTLELPVLARGAAFLFTSVDQRCAEMKPKLNETLRAQLNQNADVFNPLIAGLQRLISAEFKRNAEEVRVLIGLIGGG